MKILLGLLMLLTLAQAPSTLVKLTHTERRMRLLEKLLDKRGLMRCIFYHDLRQEPDRDCLLKYHISKRSQQYVSVLSSIVIDVVFQRHACYRTKPIFELKTCIRVVKLDFRKKFHLYIHNVEERTIFLEIVNKFIRYFAYVKVRKEDTLHLDADQAASFRQPPALEGKIITDETPVQLDGQETEPAPLDNQAPPADQDQPDGSLDMTAKLNGLADRLHALKEKLMSTFGGPQNEEPVKAEQPNEEPAQAELPKAQPEWLKNLIQSYRENNGDNNGEGVGTPEQSGAPMVLQTLGGDKPPCDKQIERLPGLPEGAQQLQTDQTPVINIYPVTKEEQENGETVNKIQPMIIVIAPLDAIKQLQPQLEQEEAAQSLAKQAELQKAMMDQAVKRREPAKGADENSSKSQTRRPLTGQKEQSSSKLAPTAQAKKIELVVPGKSASAKTKELKSRLSELIADKLKNYQAENAKLAPGSGNVQGELKPLQQADQTTTRPQAGILTFATRKHTPLTHRQRQNAHHSKLLFKPPAPENISKEVANNDALSKPLKQTTDQSSEALKNKLAQMITDQEKNSKATEGQVQAQPDASKLGNDPARQELNPLTEAEKGLAQKLQKGYEPIGTQAKTDREKDFDDSKKDTDESAKDLPSKLQVGTSTGSELKARKAAKIVPIQGKGKLLPTKKKGPNGSQQDDDAEDKSAQGTETTSQNSLPDKDSIKQPETTANPNAKVTKDQAVGGEPATNKSTGETKETAKPKMVEAGTQASLDLAGNQPKSVATEVKPSGAQADVDKAKAGQATAKAGDEKEKAKAQSTTGTDQAGATATAKPEEKKECGHAGVLSVILVVLFSIILV